MKTLLEILRATTSYFSKHGVENPRLNAEWLLAHALGKRRLDLYLEFDRPLSESELAPMRELVRERAGGKPLQHLLGTVEFMGRTFACDARALVPRPETEYLVSLLLEGGKAHASGVLIDVGTGSGVIALSLAAALPEASIIATDRCPDALALARENAVRLNLESRVAFVQADLLPRGEDRFDLVAANLPYIPTGEIGGLSREVQHDPVGALDGGPRGTEIIERLVEAVPARLAPGGILALEIGGGQGDYLVDRMRQLGYDGIERRLDLQGTERYLFAHHG